MRGARAGWRNQGQHRVSTDTQPVGPGWVREYQAHPGHNHNKPLDSTADTTDDY